ncbi:polysaccharide deacetylase [Romboutsia weinsteinii]|uniref:Polysaccharide deacetylase n=1 Tax=Romboutsia weinsteinii TaxID=2020949 RepID=A0A371IZ53_9FIRM|nr:polysaccharide deacetylase family protein [Romboutsia weinsteinii]RDY25750.1 polysaccharide deacetylase [Romboutsia weinsteinii]
MGKKFKLCSKRKVILIVGSIIVSISAVISTINIRYGYSLNNYENYRERNSSNITITEMMNKNLAKIEKGPSSIDNKIVYITVDDGPSRYTDEIIDILEKYNAKATFFLLENNMKRYPDKVNNIINNGNKAGFHGVSHDIHELYKNGASARKEFEVNQDTFFNITGETSKLIRLPYGSKPYTPCEVYNDLINCGYRIWDWNIDTQDWKLNPNQIIENVKINSENKDEIIVLIHEKQQTVECLGEILDYLSNQGYEFKTIDQNQIPQNFWSNNLYK